MILAIETATDICSVSFQDSKGEIHEKRMTRKGSHSEYLFLYIRELMNEHQFKITDLNAVLVSNGPGSYTGLRIAASAVKGLLFDENVNVYAANTLAGFAAAVLLDGENTQSDNFGRIHAVINARRSHLYHQEFSFNTTLSASTEPEIRELNEIEQMISSGDIIIGTGTDRLNQTLLESCTVFGMEKISANALIHLFNTDGGEQFFKKTTAEALESNYISSSQVNNSNIN